MDSKQNLTRRNFLWTAIAATSIAAIAVDAQGKTTASRRRPNIVFILADDMGYGDTSVYGQKKFRTPHIDRLASEGLRFTQAYAGAPVCAPSRSVLMTGLNTGHTRVRDNFALAGGHVGHKGKEVIRRASLIEDDRTIADYLAKGGYATALMGKWHLDGYDPGAIPTRHGFQTFKGWLTQTGSTQGYFPEQRYHNETLIDLPENAGGKQGLYGTTIVTEDAVDFIKSHAAEPFFLYVAYDAPHSPYLAPDLGSYANEPWDEDEKTYASMIEHLDNGVGQILETLKASGLDDETIVFFASDNGPRSEPTPEQTKVINFFDSNGPLHGYKRDMYEGGIRDPLIARWPGHIPAAHTTDVPVFFPDFVPTALDLAGAAPQHSDGISLKPYLLHPNRKATDRFLYWEFYEPSFEQAVRWGQWKAVRHGRGGPLELYNLNTDPAETVDVASQHPEIVSRIEQHIRETHKASVEYPDPA
ncbi:arylsulfatase [Terriglobus saanensis]|uniref:Sulfatase n=1 Tax=Terriglobus saanensis (strain ATCC BAA-1853 / DSM 23119 / SP1PR4) TaxID=401053 RepID=E8V2H7_TERSS|nr:arylsulfatase [Terriglobus saanensis]ADV82395.1 sulfatase [Terriglobus saanensis SP1PR4]